MFILYHNNHMSPPLSDPRLTDILTAPDPFIIALPRQRSELAVVYGDWQKHQYHEQLLNGILLIDHPNRCKYFVERGARIFEQREGVTGPWHSDKFSIYAHRYAFDGTIEDLKRLFVCEGFVF